MNNKYEITVLQLSAAHPALMDRCTLTARSVQDAAQQYAALFDPKGERHQGLANYPTFTVALWLDSNSRHFLAVQREATRLRFSPPQPSHEEFPEVRMAEWLQEYVQRSFSDVTEVADESASLASTFLSHVMTLVDWMELARRYMKET